MEKTFLEAYTVAQTGLASIRVAILRILADCPEGLSNSSISKLLGLNSGYDGHRGHITRTILATMESEGVVRQHPDTKKWFSVLSATNLLAVD